MTISIHVQMLILKKVAKRHNLKIRPDKRLCKTPYRGMNPYAAKALNQPCPKKTLTYDPRLDKTQKRIVMDIRHEILEYQEMQKGKSYKIAHKKANKFQRNIESVR